MVACACVAVFALARGARARPVMKIDFDFDATALGCRGDARGRETTCGARAVRVARTCARETANVAVKVASGEESVEEAVRALVDVGARCDASARDVVDACAEELRACATTLRAIEDECASKAKEIAGRCASEGEDAWTCAVKAAELSRDCASRVAVEAAACVDDDMDDVDVLLDDGGDDPDDGPDDPDDDRAKCDAERKELEQECHDAYDDIKRKIRDGEISFVEGMKQLANLGKTCASKAMALRKKCRPPPPPRAVRA